MKKAEFLQALASSLAMLPESEIEKTLSYYGESIEDRMEDGMPEEEAVAALGSVDKVAESVMYDMSIPALFKARVAKSKFESGNKALWTALVLIGIPVWLPLLIAAAVVFLALYVVVWAVIFSLYAAVFAMGLSGFVGALASVAMFYWRTVPVGLCTMGASLVVAALAMFSARPMVELTKLLVSFSAGMFRKTKSVFIRDREVREDEK